MDSGNGDAAKVLDRSLSCLALLCCSLVSHTSRASELRELAWSCPDILSHPTVQCSCDLPHTLRCSGGREAMQIIGRSLRSLPSHRAVSLLDCTVQNVSTLAGPLLEGVALHGLVVSSGEITDVHHTAFRGLAAPLQALGLPSNQLPTIPTAALSLLVGLDRLDLSHNKLTIVANDSFQGLTNLTFLDLSDNQLSVLSPGCFSLLPRLQTLRLGGNRLAPGALSALRELTQLQELVLRDNRLAGPLGPSLLPGLPQLRVLQLARNALSSIKRGALAGLPNLTSLNLQHNQIDVVEDFAFRELSNLTELDLSHNGIVAISGSSLAQLTRLQKLDISHNFLRTVTPELVGPLHALKELLLDDNDISIVAADALHKGTDLDRFSLADNPLNCDCNLTSFSLWLRSAPGLSQEDRSSAVCTTPPELEGALLRALPSRALTCLEGDQEVAEKPSGDEELEPVEQVSLEDFQYDGSLVHLGWAVESSALPYSCDAVFVYEVRADREVLVSSEPLHCDSSTSKDPSKLSTTVPGSRDLIPGHKHRYCIALLQGVRTSDDLSLVLGCSDIIALQRTQGETNDPHVRVAGVKSNVTNEGLLSIEISLFGYPPDRPHNLKLHATLVEPSDEQISQYFDALNNCYVSIAVFAQGSLIAQRDTQCEHLEVRMEGFLQGPYRVCAALSEYQVTGPNSRCVSAQKLSTIKLADSSAIKSLNLALLAAGLGCIAMISALVWATVKVMQKPAPFTPTHQCFVPDPAACEEVQHSRYVKLHATTKV